LEPDNTFARRVATKFSNLSEVATKLGSSQKLLALLPPRILYISWFNSPPTVLVIVTGNPGVSQGYPYPTHQKPIPLPRVRVFGR